MTKFAATIVYSPDDPKIAEIRPLHRAYLAQLRDQGDLVISGPFTDGGGALIVYQAETKEDVEKMIHADPFTKAGVFTSWVIRPWNPIFVNRNLLPE
jgi:uncharacterized protein